MPSRSPRPRRALYNHEQLHRSNPLVSQPPRLEMSNPPVHLSLDRPCTSQRRGARTKFDQKRRRRSPVSNSDAFNEEVWTTLERVLLDHPKMKRTQEDGRCAISASVISREITNEKKKNGERHVLGVVPDTSGTPDPFAYTTSERVMPRNDFKEQIACVEVSVFGLPRRRMRAIGRCGRDYELQYVRVDVLVNR